MKFTKNINFDYDLYVVLMALPANLLAPPIAPRASPTHLSLPMHKLNSTNSSNFGSLKSEDAVSSSDETGDAARVTHFASSYSRTRANSFFMLALFNLQISRCIILQKMLISLNGKCRIIWRQSSTSGSHLKVSD